MKGLFSASTKSKIKISHPNMLELDRIHSPVQSHLSPQYLCGLKYHINVPCKYASSKGLVFTFARQSPEEVRKIIFPVAIFFSHGST